MSKKILCIGEALIDMICTDKGSSLAKGENFLKKPGGAPTNVAAAIAALGGRVDLAARVGNDPFGKHLIEVMQDFGVNTNFMVVDDHYFTTLAFVSLMHNGERDFVFSRGADGQLSLEDLTAIDPAQYGIIHFGSATAFLEGPLQAAYKSLFETARQQQIFTSFDPNYRHLLFKHHTQAFIDQSWFFLKHCDFFKVSDEEALLLTGESDVESAAAQLLRETTAVFAITLGREGTLLGLHGSTQLIPSIAVNPVDTTGAGDAFVGALLYQLSKSPLSSIALQDSIQWKNMVMNANKAGARTCEFMGAMEAFRHLSSEIFKS